MLKDEIKLWITKTNKVGNAVQNDAKTEKVELEEE